MDTNTRIIINLNTWERRHNYEFFKGFQNPQCSVTSEIDCTSAYRNSKKEGTSFFVKYLYAILRAVNEIPELCYRIEQSDGEEVVVLYKKISVITPIRVGENGKFHSINIPYHKTFEKFRAAYKTAVNSIPEADSDPYAAEKQIKSDHAFNDQILLSALPDLYYTSMTFTQSTRSGNNRPLINVGKAIERNNRMIMPVAICFHHGLCDGYHISLFYEKARQYLNEL